MNELITINDEGNMNGFQELVIGVVPIAIKHGVKKVKLFGSRARGEEHAQSDYDFLISRGKIDTLIKYSAFVEDLEELLGTHVDVITDTSDDEDLIASAERDGILLYEN